MVNHTSSSAHPLRRNTSSKVSHLRVGLALIAAVCACTARAQTDQDEQKNREPSPAAAVARTSSMDVLDNKRPLAPGDEISFRIVEERDSPIILPVTVTGEVEVPMIGRVNATGKTCRELAFGIKEALEKNYFQQATVIIAQEGFGELATGRIFIFGQVGRQGVLEVKPDEEMTLGQAILLSGGFGDFADKRKVRIIRKRAGKEPEKITVDLKDVLEKGRIEKDIKLEPGDYIFVPERWLNF